MLILLHTFPKRFHLRSSGFLDDEKPTFHRYVLHTDTEYFFHKFGDDNHADKGNLRVRRLPEIILESSGCRCIVRSLLSLLSDRETSGKPAGIHYRVRLDVIYQPNKRRFNFSPIHTSNSCLSLWGQFFLLLYCQIFIYNKRVDS